MKGESDKTKKDMEALDGCSTQRKEGKRMKRKEQEGVGQCEQYRQGTCTAVKLSSGGRRNVCAFKEYIYFRNEMSARDSESA